METTEIATPDAIDRTLQIVAWCVVVFGGLWLVTSVMGYFHRRAYNLTHAESGGSKNIKPDFLKVDQGQRDAAIARGEAYGQTLSDREKPSAAPRSPVQTLSTWSRIAATGAAVIGLVATVVGTLQKIDSIQAGVERLSSWETFSAIVRENAVGATVAAIVIVANVVVVVKKMQKPAAE
jgi:hypothetical protein